MAMLIMTVGLFGLLQSINVAFEHNLRNRLREEATQIGEEKMNDLQAKPFDNISASHCCLVPRTICGAFRNFSVIQLSSSLPDDASCTSKKLTVAVSWRFKNVKIPPHVIYTVKTK